jgi:N-acetylmuramic acid 6-phosphate etherase
MNNPAVLDLLPTEQVRPGLEDLDTRPVEDVVGELLAAEAGVAAVLNAARADLAAAAAAIAERLGSGGRLVYVGAGTPGRIAALDAVECGPTFGVPDGTVVAMVAGGEQAVGRALEEAEDDVAAARANLSGLQLSRRDVVVGITASGRTPFVVEALAVARSAGAVTIAVTNNAGAPVARAVDHRIELLTGPEVVGGSTRLTAGTAQKIALNVLSTAAMIRGGRTYGAWMVGVQATNDKLRRRAARIVQEITGVTASEATDALEAAASETAVALVMLLRGVEPAVARSRLRDAGGHVRNTLENGRAHE